MVRITGPLKIEHRQRSHFSSRSDAQVAACATSFEIIAVRHPGHKLADKKPINVLKYITIV